MNSKACLRRQLTMARDYTESLLKEFTTPEQWTHQVDKNANHALWFAGHMAISDNFFVSNLRPSLAVSRPEWQERFGTGSRPVNDPAAYPPPAEVVAFMRDRRRALLAALDEMSEAELDEPTPKEVQGIFATKGAIFEVAVWHEGLHSGQVSVARRAMGHKPVMGGA